MNNMYGDQGMLRMNRILDRVEFPGLQFRVGRVPHAEKPEGFDYFLQIVKPQAICTVTGMESEWKSRKWPLSVYMVDGEVVQTALKAVLTAFEHEIRENFKVDGTAPFQPHFDLDALVSFAKDPENTQKRQEMAKNG
jgi:hypothetical protein